MPSSSYRRYRRRVVQARPTAEKTVNVITVKSKTLKGKDTIKAKYALRAPNGTFWDGNARKMMEAANPQTWNVRFLPDPHFWNSKKLAANAWKKYDLERMCGAAVPDLTMVEFEFRAVEKSSIPSSEIDATYSEIISLRAKRYCDSTMSVLIDRLLRRCGGDPVEVQKYRYAIKRKSGTKKLMDDKFPQSISNLNYTVLNRENDAVMARLILGSGMVGYFDLEPFLDHRSARAGFVENQMG